MCNGFSKIAMSPEVPTHTYCSPQSMPVDVGLACACRDRWTWQQSAGSGQAVVVACCNLLAALLRHRVKGLRRCMALLTASCRKLLQQLAAWLLQTSQSGSHTLPLGSGASSIRSKPHSASRIPQEGSRPGAFSAEALHPAFKALGRVYTALADQKVCTRPSLCIRCMAVGLMMMLKQTSSQHKVLHDACIRLNCV